MVRVVNEYQREIDRLYRMEYGEPAELVYRFVGTLLGSVIIALYTGWSGPWVWCFGYFFLHLLYIRFIGARRTNTTYPDLVLANIFFLCLLSWFIWMPAWMMVQQDEALQYSGCGILGCLFVFMIRRSEYYLWVIFAQIAIFALVLAIVVFIVSMRQDSALGIFGMAYSALAFLVYASQSIFISRRQRMATEAAAERSAQSQKMEAVGQLAGGVAHDFNNMLTAIIGNLDLYEEISDPKERAHFIRMAREAAWRSEAIVEQLLSYSRISKGNPARQSANSLIRSSVRLARLMVPASITIESEEYSHEMVIEVDGDLLLTAIMNLVSNGADALKGTGHLCLSTSLSNMSSPFHSASGGEILPGEYVVFSVSDTGPGIPKEVFQRVVDPFFTTKPVGKGSGLGLAMVSGFAERSGGGLTLESSRNGTVAKIFLPLVELNDTQKTADISASRAAFPQSRYGSSPVP